MHSQLLEGQAVTRQKPTKERDPLHLLANQASQATTIEEICRAAGDLGDSLIEGITVANRHPETNFGRSVGREVSPPFDDDVQESGKPAAN